MRRHGGREPRALQRRGPVARVGRVPPDPASGGALLFYEHVRSSNPIVALLEDLATPLWRRVAGNCHPNRDTLAAVQNAGFRLRDVRRFGFAPTGGPPVAHILGSAGVD